MSDSPKKNDGAATSNERPLAELAADDVGEPVWKTPFLFKTAAPDVFAEIQAVRGENDGVATPKMIVEWAEKNPGSLLHQEIFSVDDTTAAYRYRVEKARKILLNIRIRKFEEATGTQVETRLFVKIRVKDRTNYVDPQSIVQYDVASDTLKEAIRYFKNGLDRYRELRRVLGPLYDTLETMINRLSATLGV